MQNNFHNLIHDQEAVGWKNGLHDELTLQTFYQKRHKFYQTKSFDLIPYYGFSLGNVLIGVHLGGFFRYGIHLPDDFGPSRPTLGDPDSFISPWVAIPVSQTSYYIYGGLHGNALAHNIFLDGNTFQPSHHVTKFPMTYSAEVGFGFRIRSSALIWRFVTCSPEFEERINYNSFASINFIYSFAKN